jgi:hypothetical protein
MNTFEIMTMFELFKLCTLKAVRLETTMGKLPNTMRVIVSLLSLGDWPDGMPMPCTVDDDDCGDDGESIGLYGLFMSVQLPSSPV